MGTQHPWQVAEVLVDHATSSELEADERDLARSLKSAGRRATFAAGRIAARRALVALGCDGVRVLGAPGGAPALIGAPRDVVISITHSAGRAFAVAARASRVGIDFCAFSSADRLATLAPRFLRAERSLLGSDRNLVATWALKEAGLKALGLGSVDGGLVDGSAAVEVESISPPRLRPADLRAHVSFTDAGALAIVWAA